MRRVGRSFSRAFGTYKGGVAPVLTSTPVWQSPAAGALASATGYAQYSQQFTATSPVGNPLSYTVTTGTIPPGTSLSSAGLLSGVLANPTSTTTYSFTIRASDGSTYADRSYSLAVTAAAQADSLSAYVVGLYHLDDYTDASGTGNIVAANTNATNGITTPAKFGTGSLGFTGGSQPATLDVRVPANAKLSAGTGDFCAEFFLKHGTPLQYSDLFQTAGYPAGATGSTRLTGSIDFYNWATTRDATNHTVPSAATAGGGKYLTVQVNDGTNTPNLYSATNPNDGAWHHWAVTRSGSTVRLFCDGVLEDTLTYSGPVDFGSKYGLQFGRWLNNGYATGGMNGNIDELRLTIGAARYTANFTPPTQAFGYP